MIYYTRHGRMAKTTPHSNRTHKIKDRPGQNIADMKRKLYSFKDELMLWRYNGGGGGEGFGERMIEMPEMKWQNRCLPKPMEMLAIIHANGFWRQKTMEIKVTCRGLKWLQREKCKYFRLATILEVCIARMIEEIVEWGENILKTLGSV